MNETILTWNVPNWITVVLMVFLGFAILGFASQAVVKMRGGENA